MSVNSKMTAIADKIRTLLGLSGTMGLDAMATNLGTANTEVSSQTDLIAQIFTALEGKTGESGGGAVTGTYTTANTGMHNIEHGLGKIPSGFVIWIDSWGDMAAKTLAVGIKTGLVNNEDGTTMRSEKNILCQQSYSSSDRVVLNTTGNMDTTLESENKLSNSTNDAWDKAAVNKKYLAFNVASSAVNNGTMWSSKTYHWIVW